MIPKLWDRVSYEKLGREEVGIIVDVYYDEKEPEETTYDLIQTQGLTDSCVHPDDFSKVEPESEVPLQYYLEHRSWRVQARGRERLSLENNIPMLLDKVQFYQHEKINMHSYGRVLCEGILFSWIKTDYPETALAGVLITNVLECDEDANLNLEDCKELLVDSQETLNLRNVIKVERVSIEEALTSDTQDWRDLANDFLMGKVPRPYMGDLSFIKFPQA